jgi:septum formation protein
MENEREPQASGNRSETKRGDDGKLLLASASPRRAEILRAVGWPFETLATHMDETLMPGESAEAAVERLALGKAEEAARARPSSLVLGADTIVLVDSEILGKPQDEMDARRMLRKLSGRWHDVLTVVAPGAQRKREPSRGRT